MFFGYLWQRDNRIKKEFLSGLVYQNRGEDALKQGIG